MERKRVLDGCHRHRRDQAGRFPAAGGAATAAAAHGLPAGMIFSVHHSRGRLAVVFLDICGLAA